MTKLLGMLLCGSACLLLGLGATGCTKKTTTTDKKTTETTTSKNPDNTTSSTTKTKETSTAVTKPVDHANNTTTTTTTTTGTMLTLKQPTDVTIKQGDTAKVNVAITRGSKYSDPVDVKLTGLPDGVTADTSNIAKDASTADIMLKASATATPVDNHKVMVWAGTGATKQESSFKLTVTKK